MDSKLKILYKELCEYKFFDFYRINYKQNNYDKITKWYFYDENEKFNILSFDQICNKNVSLNDIIERKWYINNETNLFSYEIITDIYNFTDNIKPYLIKMDENYKNNIKYIKQLSEVIDNYDYKDNKTINWRILNASKSIEYIIISLNIFLNNNENNIQINIKHKNKKEKIENYSFDKLLAYIKKNNIKRENKNIDPELINDQKNENELNITMKNLSIHKEIENRYVIRPRNEVSNSYKNLFIKKNLITRLSIQSCKYKCQLLEENIGK